VREHQRDSSKLCRCRIFQFEADNATSENVFEFAQRYVRWMDAVMTEPRMVGCQSCGLKRVALPMRRICSRACVNDGPRDVVVVQRPPSR
jgi:hypothetical protein